MTTKTLKKKTQEYLEIADDKIVKAVYTILESHINSFDADIEFTTEQLKELNKRRKEHLAGKGKTYTLAEIKGKIHDKHKK